jgi:SAM-dependent methyltransferase
VKDPIAATTAYYEAVAEEYVKRWLDPAVILNFLEGFIALLAGKGRILDVGCGPGRDAKFFSDRGFGVVGIDMSRRLLSIAQQVASQVPFLKMDMRSLAFQPSSFDGIWACASLIHVPRGEALATLCGFRRALKSNGSLYVSVKKGEGRASQSEAGGHQRLVFYYQPDELRRLVEDAGFEIVEMDVAQAHAVFINVFARTR